MPKAAPASPPRDRPRPYPERRHGQADTGAEDPVRSFHMGTWGPGSDENDTAGDALLELEEEFYLDDLEGQALADAQDAVLLSKDDYDDRGLAGLVVQMLHEGYRIPLDVLERATRMLNVEDVDAAGWHDEGASRRTAIELGSTP